ncbi:hypothetical protein Y032_0688g1549 [Ancylostoma ceylanicum]|uniref:Uncharacterized protein n=1 Tax=Ancylostoma ceylanicum TaxID=53326 RepID=A0A016WGE0_9BILA|nr:hypothetical protein Y032_0688g1549 [Ancylostoma ceylanicum]
MERNISGFLMKITGKLGTVFSQILLDVPPPQEGPVVERLPERFATVGRLDTKIRHRLVYKNGQLDQCLQLDQYPSAFRHYSMVPATILLLLMVRSTVACLGGGGGGGGACCMPMMQCGPSMPMCGGGGGAYAVAGPMMGSYAMAPSYAQAPSYNVAPSYAAAPAPSYQAAPSYAPAPAMPYPSGPSYQSGPSGPSYAPPAPPIPPPPAPPTAGPVYMPEPAPYRQTIGARGVRQDQQAVTDAVVSVQEAKSSTDFDAADHAMLLQ